MPKINAFNHNTGINGHRYFWLYSSEFSYFTTRIYNFILY